MYRKNKYDEFASILVKWKTEILNSFRRPYENIKLSNAYSENINGKLRTYITVSRGLATLNGLDVERSSL